MHRTIGTRNRLLNARYQVAHTPVIDMESHPPPAEGGLPLHVVVAVLQFALPEIMSLG